MEGTAARLLEFATLTAARTGEAIDAQWTEVRPEAGTWTVPAEWTKAGEQPLVLLSPRTVAVLQQHRGLDERFVFPLPTIADQPISDIAMPAALRRKQAAWWREVARANAPADRAGQVGEPASQAP